MQYEIVDSKHNLIFKSSNKRLVNDVYDYLNHELDEEFVDTNVSKIKEPVGSFRMIEVIHDSSK